MKKKLTISRTLGLIFLAGVAFTACKKNGNVTTKEEIVSRTGSSNQTSASESATLSESAILRVERPLVVGNGTFVIMNRKSGKCLDIAGTTNNTPVQQYGGNNANNQRWTLTALNGGYYRIASVAAGGRSLDGAGTAEGGNVQVYDYWGGNNQQWQFVSTSGGCYRIVNRASGRCLAVVNGALTDNADVNQYASTGGENEQWAVLAVNYNGQIGWRWSSTAGVPADVNARITAAMNDACARYNRGADWAARTLTVEYNTSVPNADGNISGHIRFGPNTVYQNTRCAMHEIAHTHGVGTTAGWNAVTSTGWYTGTHGLATIRAFEHQGVNLEITPGHFLHPVALNQNYDFNETTAYRHVKLVRAFDEDGCY